MSKAFTELAGYGYPEGVRPRNLLGRVLDACGALAQLLRGVAVLAAITAVYLGPAALDAALDAWLGNTLPPTVEESAAVCGAGVTESASAESCGVTVSAAVCDSGVMKGGAR